MNQPLSVWGLDSQFTSFRKLIIKDIKSISIVETNLCFEFYLFNRSIQRVEIVGYVVSKAIKAKKIILCIDDGSDVIQCVKFYDENDYDRSLPYSKTSLGDVVSLKGKIVVFNNDLVIHATGIEIIEDPNMEVLHMVQSMYAFQNIYSKPFQYAGARPWVDYNPFTSCSCSNITPNKLLVREECLYCPCIGGGNNGTQQTKRFKYDQKDGLLCIYMLHLLLRKQKERLQHISIDSSRNSNTHVSDRCYALTLDQLCDDSILRRVASFIAYYDARLRLLANGALYCHQVLAAMKDRSCRTEWCSDSTPSAICPFCHAVGNDLEFKLDPRMIQASTKLVHHCMQNLYDEGLISICTSLSESDDSNSLPLPQQSVPSGDCEVSRKVIVNSASDIILPTLLRFQRDALRNRLPVQDIDEYVVNASIKFLSESQDKTKNPDMSSGLNDIDGPVDPSFVANSNSKDIYSIQEARGYSNVAPWRVDFTWKNYKKKKMLE